MNAKMRNFNEQLETYLKCLESVNAEDIEQQNLEPEGAEHFALRPDPLDGKVWVIFGSNQIAESRQLTLNRIKIRYDSEKKVHDRKGHICTQRCPLNLEGWKKKRANKRREATRREQNIALSGAIRQAEIARRKEPKERRWGDSEQHVF